MALAKFVKKNQKMIIAAVVVTVVVVVGIVVYTHMGKEAEPSTNASSAEKTAEKTAAPEPTHRFAEGTPQACPSGYRAVSETECSPDSVKMKSVSWESTTKSETDEGYPKGCYTVETAAPPFQLYWNNHSVGRNDHPNVVARRLCKRS